MPRGNINNIREHGFDKLTAEERQKLASKAGKQSVKKRQEKRAMKSIVKMVLDMPAPKAVKDKMRLLGIQDEDATYRVGVVVGLLQRALAGNTNAARYIMELAYDDPTIALKFQEVNIKADELALKKEEGADGGAGELLLSLLRSAWGNEEEKPIKKKNQRKAGK